MNCSKAKKLIPQFLDYALSEHETGRLQEHLRTCPVCRKELKLYDHSWDMLKDYPQVDPAPGYISRFWTRLSLETPQHEGIWENIKETLFGKEFTPARAFAAVAFVCVLMISLGVNWFSEKEFSGLPPEEIEFIENIDLAEYFDVIEDLDFVEDFDVIENFDKFYKQG